MRPVAPEPPCKQALAAVGAGAGVRGALVSLAPWHGTHAYEQLLVGMVAPWRAPCRPSLVPRRAISTTNPPCEQSLAVVEVGAGVLVVLPVPVSVVGVLVVVPSLALTWPLAPAIPPARGRVLGYPGIVLVVVACRRTLVTWPLAPTIHP
jgi:hypothetical protein